MTSSHACAGVVACRPAVECYRRRQTPATIASLAPLHYHRHHRLLHQYGSTKRHNKTGQVQTKTKHPVQLQERYPVPH